MNKTILKNLKNILKANLFVSIHIFKAILTKRFAFNIFFRFFKIVLFICYRPNCSFAYFLEYVPLFLDDKLNVNNFQIAKIQPQGVA